MHQTPIFLRLELIVQGVAVRSQFGDRHTGAQHFHIGRDVFESVLHRIDHIGRRFLVANPPRTRDVDANAIAPNKVCVERDDFVLLTYPGATFLKPWVGALSR